MSGKPFPRALTAALIGSTLCFIAALALPKAITAGALMGVLMIAFAATQVIAIPIALFLLFRRDYKTRANMVITFIATLPFVAGLAGVLSMVVRHS